jgi:hypothetical protein
MQLTLRVRRITCAEDILEGNAARTRYVKFQQNSKNGIE